ncbi:MAG: hypothetical protein O3B84_06995 [Chloroflexi bacterium]|nr:hypothetical protein [Chloroflexota bacterium]
MLSKRSLLLAGFIGLLSITALACTIQVESNAPSAAMPDIDAAVRARLATAVSGTPTKTVSSQPTLVPLAETTPVTRAAGSPAGRTSNEVVTSLRAYFADQISMVPDPARVAELDREVNRILFTAAYVGEGRWEVIGPGMEKGSDGLLSWVSGQWVLDDATLTPSALDGQAREFHPFLQLVMRNR